MSYSASGTVQVKGGVVTQLRAITKSAREGQDPDGKEQLDAAVAAARQVIESGVMGEGPHHVAISGHANPGYKDRDGYANDQLSIQISRVDNRYPSR